MRKFMDLVLCHETADFDTLGAAVAVTRLRPGSRVVLTGGSAPAVRAFLALHRDEYALIERRAVEISQLRSLTIVDTHQRDRLGYAADWVDYAVANQCPIWIYDHHVGYSVQRPNEDAGDGENIPATYTQIEAVGATTTLVVEALKERSIVLSVPEATVMALGIHGDTGSLTFAQTTVRDAQALTWLMEQGASLRAIADFAEPGLSPQLQRLLPAALNQLTHEIHDGITFAYVLLTTHGRVPGLSSLVGQLMVATQSDVLLLGAAAGKPSPAVSSPADGSKLTLIGRSRLASRPNNQPSNGPTALHLGHVLGNLGGGGHAGAAAATLQTDNPEAVFQQTVANIRDRLPRAPQALDLMSAPVRTIRPDTSIVDAQRILLRYGHVGLTVVNDRDQLVGMISRRDIELALHYGFGHAPVKGYMTTRVKTIAPDTRLPEIQQLMVTYDIGRLPVLDNHRLVGIVTRTDALRQLYYSQLNPENRYPPADLDARNSGAIEQDFIDAEAAPNSAVNYSAAKPLEDLLTRLQTAIHPQLWEMLMQITQAAQQRGWHLYLIGGAVRDLLLNAGEPLILQDVDLVVDGLDVQATVGAGLTLAEIVQTQHPEAELQTYGKFQTAALIWHHHSVLGSLMIDIATARTEFYPYPAANPEVEPSSIRQDLYRRDFTINAMALRLSQPGGELLDFFGGRLDLTQRHIRVLHPNSFIEDPTRIYRGVRFAVRLGFSLESETERYIHHAISSGIYTQMQAEVAVIPALQTRLKRELKYIFEAHYWPAALRLLDQLGALQCLHSRLALSDRLWHQLRRLSDWLDRVSDRYPQLVPWQLRLEIVLTHLDVAARIQVAQTLQLPEDSQERLKQLDSAEAELHQQLAHSSLPSQIARCLRERDVALLLLIGARHPRPLGETIWAYLTRWSQVKAPLNGHDLKQLGYQPGKQYKVLLSVLQDAMLDGTSKTREEAIAFLKAHYPLPTPFED